MSVLLVAHFLGDFTPLATRQMQEAKTGARSPGPIAAHAAVHALLVVGAVAAVRPAWAPLLAAAGLEFLSHAVIDFAKMRVAVGRPALLDPEGAPFWYLFGVDQLGHGLVLVGIAALVL